MSHRNAACLLYVPLAALLMTVPGTAQAPVAAPDLVPPPAWAFNDLACAPALAAPTRAKGEAPPPPSPYRVIGSQETGIKDLMGPSDTLVISGGSSAGLQTGQRYFVRRQIETLVAEPPLPPTIHTAGWIQILGVDTAIATATILHACDGILLDDYLEPYAPPVIAVRAMPGTTPAYENMGRIVTGREGFQTAGTGQIMTIDRGSNGGVVIGQRFLVFRDKRALFVETNRRSKTFGVAAANRPLVEIGEVLVVAVRPDDASVQILGSKDAITMGDFIAPIR